MNFECAEKICSNCEKCDATHLCMTCCWDTTISACPNGLLTSEMIFQNLKRVMQSALFCSSCQAIHLKIKVSKNHCVLPFNAYILPCCNCDDSESLHLCLECLVDNKLPKTINNTSSTHLTDGLISWMQANNINYCSACVKLHRKVKCYQHHQHSIPIYLAPCLQSIVKRMLTLGHKDAVATITDNSQNNKFNRIELILFVSQVIDVWKPKLIQLLQSGIESAMEMIETLYEDVTERTFMDIFFWRSVLIMAALCVILNALCRRVLGGITTAAAAVALLSVAQYFQRVHHMKQKVVTNIPRNHQQHQPTKFNNNSSINPLHSYDPNNTGTFQDEFSYPLQGKPAQLKKRVRPYVGKKKRIVSDFE